jgi:hypothetical protein
MAGGHAIDTPAMEVFAGSPLETMGAPYPGLVPGEYVRALPQQEVPDADFDLSCNDMINSSPILDGHASQNATDLDPGKRQSDTCEQIVENVRQERETMPLREFQLSTEGIKKELARQEILNKKMEDANSDSLVMDRNLRLGRMANRSV